MIGKRNICVKLRNKERGVCNMRKYIKPVLDLVILRAEEKFASGSGCLVYGSCTEEQKAAMAGAGHPVTLEQ